MTWARTRARRALPDVAAAGLIALAIFLSFGHAFLNYDSFYALVWGDDLVHGRTPRYEVPVAPTPHPLATLVAAAVSPLGDAAEDVLLAIVLLAVGALCVGLFRLGQALYAWPVGLLAAAIVATRVPILSFGVRGYVDLPTAALIVWAAVLEARRPRRGVPVLALLSLAGLLRPEAWLFAGAYVLWLAPPLGWARRLRLAALAAAAPLAWMLSDLLVTGDPLWSLEGTSDLARELGRARGLDDVPEVVPRRLGEILRLPELIAAVLGFGAGLLWLRRRTLLPAAVAALNGVAFLALAISGLPLLGRYLFLAATMLALFAALAALGWLALEPGDPLRARWRAGAAAALAALAVFAPMQAGRLDDLRDDVARRDRVQADLRDLVRTPAAEAALERCERIRVPSHRPIPLLAYWADRRPADIAVLGPETPPPGGALALLPATAEVARLSILDPREPGAAALPHLEVPVNDSVAARNRSWVLAGSCAA